MINALSMDGMFVLVIAFFVMVFLVITSMTIKILKGANGNKNPETITRRIIEVGRRTPTKGRRKILPSPSTTKL